MSDKLSEAQLENFEEAFSTRTSGCRRECACGKTYYHEDDCYDWEEGELEALRAGSAIPLGYSVGSLYFQGQEYVDACTCWHPLALKAHIFIMDHARAIGDYLKREKQRKQDEATDSPTFPDDV